MARSRTSQAAYEGLKTAPTHTRAILGFLAERPEGATSEEAEEVLNIRHQTCSARFTDLKNASAIQPTGQTKPTSTGSDAEVVRLVPGLSVDDAFERFRAWQRADREARGVTVAAHEALEEAARDWVSSVGTDDEGDAIEALLDASWGAFGQGPRPRRPSLLDDDFS